MAECVFDHLVGDLAVALAGNHVDRRLAADELRERRHHDGIAELGADAHGLLQRVRQPVLHPDLAELEGEVGDHPARNLVAVLAGIEATGRPAGKPSRAATVSKCAVTGRSDSRSRSGSWPSAPAFAATSKVDGFDEPSDSGGSAVLTIFIPPAMASRTHMQAEPGGAVGVELDRGGARVLQHDRDQRPRALGRQQPARVLEAEPPDVERGGLAAALGVVGVGMDRRDRVDQVEDHAEPGGVRGVDPALPAGIFVPRIGDP